MSEQKKSFWDSVGNGLGHGLAKVGLATVTESNEDIQQPSQAVTSPVVAQRSPVVPVVPAGDPRLAETDVIVRKILIAAMQNDGAPLVEEVSDLLETLLESIPDERARYKAALKILVKKGHMVSAILTDFDKCLGVLEQTKVAFEADNNAMLDKTVGAKRRNVESLNTQIAQVQTQLEKLIQQRDQEQAGITGEQNKIELVQSRFTVNYSAIRLDIEAHRAQIANYGEGL